MIKPCIPSEDFQRIALKSNLSDEDIIRKTKAILHLANTGQPKLVIQMIQNTKQEWFFEALLQGCKIFGKGQVRLGKNLRSLKKNGEYIFALLLVHAPATCNLETWLDRNEITELNLGDYITSIDWVRKFAIHLHPRFPNLTKIISHAIELTVDKEFNSLDDTQKNLILKTFRACTGDLIIYLENQLDKEFFASLLDGFSFNLSLTGPGAKIISEEIIDILCRFDGIIKLPDLEELSSTKLARKLWQRSHKVSFPKLVAISDEVAGLLALMNDIVVAPLIFDSFSKINQQDYTTAHILIRKGFPLNLDTLETVPERLWKIIARHNEDISLNGLKHLDDRFALLLARHKHALSLDSITSLSPRARRLLQYRCGKLSLKGLKN